MPYPCAGLKLVLNVALSSPSGLSNVASAGLSQLVPLPQSPVSRGRLGQIYGTVNGLLLDQPRGAAPLPRNCMCHAKIQISNSSSRNNSMFPAHGKSPTRRGVRRLNRGTGVQGAQGHERQSSRVAPVASTFKCQTKGTIVTQNEICRWENLTGPFLVQTFGSQTPAPSSLLLAKQPLDIEDQTGRHGAQPSHQAYPTVYDNEL